MNVKQLFAAALVTCLIQASTSVIQAAPCNDPVYSWDCRIVMCTTWRESRWKHDAVSADGDQVGDWQISIYWHKWRVERLLGHPLGYSQAVEALSDPAVNWAVAWELYTEAGWQPWRGGCSYDVPEQ